MILSLETKAAVVRGDRGDRKSSIMGDLLVSISAQFRRPVAGDDWQPEVASDPDGFIDGGIDVTVKSSRVWPFSGHFDQETKIVH